MILGVDSTMSDSRDNKNGSAFCLQMHVWVRQCFMDLAALEKSTAWRMASISLSAISSCLKPIMMNKRH